MAEGQTRRQVGPRVKLRDVARAAGVSITVVSRALGGYSDVGPATRERVIRLVGEMGYRPSTRAQSLVRGTTAPARCAVVSLGADPEHFSRSLFSGVLLAGIAAQAPAEQMDVHLVSLPQEPAEWASALAAIAAADQADGLLLVTFLQLAPEHVAPLDRAGVPYVLVNRHFDYFGEHPANCVAIDYCGATERTVDHLVRLGHRRLVHLLPADENSTVLDHAAGWQRGIAHHGLSPADAPMVRFHGAHHEAGLEAGTRLLLDGLPDGGQRPTAIVGFNDFVAHGVLRAALEAGVRVPEELSVIGFNNLVARYTFPPLCSHEIHLREVGAAAVSLLAALMRGEVAKPRRITVDPDFVCRGSCGPPL